MIPVTRSCRKTPGIAGTWKQYSDRKLTGFFPLNSCQLPVFSDRNRPEIIGKNPKNCLLEYCFHKIIGITGTGRFRARLFDLGCYRKKTHMSSHIAQKYLMLMCSVHILCFSFFFTFYSLALVLSQTSTST